MKYKNQIIFLLFLNLIIVLISIFTGNLTRKLEITNSEIKQDIEKQKQQLNINTIELSLYNNSNYLKKLHNIYFSTEENFYEKKIVSLSDISNIKDESIILVNVKSK